MDKKVKWPKEYLHTPYSKKSIEQIWDDIDGYSFESSFEKEEKKDKIDFVVVLPPLNYKGKFLKGVFYSQAVDKILDTIPGIKDMFISVANSMFSSYPMSQSADCYFTSYNNPLKEEYYRKKYPQKDVILIPLQDADFANEYEMAPVKGYKKDLDIFCTTTPYPFKNITMFAKGIKAYEKKYGKILKVEYAIGMKEAKRLEDGTFDYSKLRSDAQFQLDSVKLILGGNIEKYIDFYPYIKHDELKNHYSRAKCAVLCSLLEGKNRFIHEAQSCDVPVIVFNDFNKYARGNHPAFYPRGGEYVSEFTPEALADTIHKVITHPNAYTPRESYLKYSGRKNFIDNLISYIPYYQWNVPDYNGKITDNIWINLAFHYNYQIPYFDFIYEKNTLNHTRGIEKIKELYDYYSTMI